MSSLHVIGSAVEGRSLEEGPPEAQSTEEAIRGLFEGDGTVTLVTAFFTANAYHDLASDIRAFLDRSPDNELVCVLGGGADQVSSTIVRDLLHLDRADQVHLYRYSQKFLHAKLYARAGPDPVIVLTSANLTRTAFEQNVEFGTVITGESVEDPMVEPFFDWLDALVAESQPFRRRHLFVPLRLGVTITNWGKKARLVPLGRAVRIVPLRVALFLSVVGWLVAGRPWIGL